MENKIAKFGCFFGFLSIFLYYISPLFGSWWLSMILHGRSDHIRYSGVRLNAFGAIYTDDYNRQILGAFGILAGYLTLIGSIILLFGNIYRNKVLGLIGGIFIAIGPLLFLAALYMPMADRYFLKYYIEKGILFGARKVKVWASGSSGLHLWCLGPGFYIALVAGILGIIGAAMISDYDNI